MSDLFEAQRDANRSAAEPLSVRMRPRSLDEFVGQEHFLGSGKLLRRMLEADQLTSVVFYGPPGTGKTTLAEVIARHTKRDFRRAHAAEAGVREVRQILGDARRRLEEAAVRTIFFLDEIHRFSKSQQDVLLGDVERGVVTLIGATTENPFFAINSPLVSRSAIFQFEPLGEEQIIALLRRALEDETRGYGGRGLDVADEALRHWATMSDGDARRALSALETAVLSTPAGQAIDLAVAEQSIQRKAMVYDGTGDEHYDVISAFIKSMRGSDPDATVYWLARMLEAGEDPRFIARRIAILASEDIGNADPQALCVAAAAWQVAERVGLPECQLTLSQAAIYMATAPKSNASAQAIWSAAKDVKSGRTVAVPEHLRDGHYPGAERLGHASGYQSSHETPSGWVDQQYLGTGTKYYRPTQRGHEKRIGEYLEWIERQRGKKEGG